MDRSTWGIGLGIATANEKGKGKLSINKQCKMEMNKVPNIVGAGSTR